MGKAKSVSPSSSHSDLYLAAKEKVWMELKEGKLLGYRFEKDKKLGNLVIDFYSSVLHFAIILDEDISDNRFMDKETQYDLEQMGIGFLHFTVSQVMKNYNYVTRSIHFWIQNWENENL